jgi:hypothetical protein
MSASTNGSAKSASPFTDNFMQFANGILCEWNIPGAAIAVVDGNDIFSEVRFVHRRVFTVALLEGYKSIINMESGYFLTGVWFFKST